MTKNTFLHEFKGAAFNLGQYFVSSDTPLIINWDTGEEVVFKDIEDLYENAMIHDVPLKAIIEKAEVKDIFGISLDDSGIQILTPEEAEEYLSS